MSNEKVLNGILKSSQMGVFGITTVLDKATQPELRKALKSQRKEYSEIHQEAQRLALELGCGIQEVPPLARGMSAMMSGAQLMFGRKNSKIAGMMIQGNTRGMIKSLKDIHRFPDPDPEVAALSRRMLETEKSNIRQMRSFL